MSYDPKLGYKRLAHKPGGAFINAEWEIELLKR